MFTIENIINSITTNRREFGVFFLQAQSHLPRPNRYSLEAIADVADEREAFRIALQFAQSRGWLEDFIAVIIEERKHDGTLTDPARVVAGPQTPFRSGLQAIVAASKGQINPILASTHLPRAMRATGKILIDGVSTGTGVLIGPDLVLTAWHVVRSLFSIVDGNWELAPHGPPLSVEFDDVSSWVIGRTSHPQRVAVADSWKVAFSSCHQVELNDHLPGDLTELKDHWDYALIRLAKPLRRASFSRDTWGELPRANDMIFLFHHAGGMSQKLDVGNILASRNDQLPAIPNYRFLHQCNTWNGTSGGPCFDRGFALVGIHQGGFQEGNNPPTCNRGIPINRIVEHLQSLPEAEIAWRLTDRRLHSLGPKNRSEPVIGCGEFQELIWRSAKTDDLGRIVVISGDSHSGKTFRTRLLTSMLPEDKHLSITLGADEFATKAPLEFAALLCERSGGEFGSVAPFDNVNSTPIVWLRDEVLPRILQVLEEKQRGRAVWIILTELNKFEIRQPELGDLLLLLYEQVIERKWLRFVLDGMQTDVPDTLRYRFVENHRVEELTREDVHLCIEHTLQTLGIHEDVAMAAEFGADDAYESYQTVAGERDAIPRLKQGVQKFVQKILTKLRSRSN